jgi:hypothetical protein
MPWIVGREFMTRCDLRRLVQASASVSGDYGGMPLKIICAVLDVFSWPLVHHRRCIVVAWPVARRSSCA